MVYNSGRKAEIAARFRQNFRAHKIVVSRKLLFELRERVLIAAHLVLFEQQADPGYVGLRVFQILFHFELWMAPPAREFSAFRESVARPAW